MIWARNARRRDCRAEVSTGDRGFSGVLGTTRNFSKRFARDESGAVIILVGLVIIVLALFAGVAFDSARGYLLKSKLSGALDAAGLAGGRVMHLTNAERDADINAYFQANFPPGFMGATTPPLVIVDNATETEPATTLTVTANASVGTTLMRLLGIDDMTVAARAVIQRQVRGLEVVMVLDNTYSMNGTKIADLRTAANSLVDILYGGQETVPNLWVGLVPFVHSVNVGNQHADWLVQAPAGPPAFPHLAARAVACNPSDDYEDVPNTNRCEQILTTAFDHGNGPDTTLPFYHSNYYDGGPTFGPANIGWKGCVEARIRPDDGSDINDDPPSVRAFRPYFYPESRYDGGTEDNAWTAGVTSNDGGTSGARGPNKGCADPILHLTQPKTTIKNAINAMTVWQYGGTAIKLGLAWGWRVISPRWKGLWDPGSPNLPLDYDEPLMDKAIILLTDGEHFFWNQGPPSGGHDDKGYNSHGRLDWGRLHNAGGTAITTSGAGVAELDRRLGILCQNIKDASGNGVRIYTIMLEISSPSLEPLFRGCASQPEFYFESPSSSDLEAVFQAIANDLATLRIAQ
ncbi:MAG: pilus assembly protein [Alphaproteobacteria bacterium]|nr:pilus assembly protein [Alphaproteobacteria bacterium]